MTVSVSTRTGKLLLGVGAILLIHVIGVSTYHSIYRDRLLPGVLLDGRLVGGLTKTEFLRETEAGRADLMGRQRPISLRNPNTNEQVNLPTAPFLLIDGEHLWNQAFAAGHDPKSGWFYAPLLLRWTRPSFAISDALKIDVPELQTHTNAAVTAAGWTQTAQEARFRFESAAEETNALRVTIEPAKAEQQLDLATSIDRIITHLQKDETGIVDISLSAGPTPTRTAEALAPLLPQAQRWTSGTLTLKSDGTETALPPTTIADWIEVQANSSNPAVLALGLNPQRTETFLNTLPSVRLQEPKNGTLTVSPENTLINLTAPTRGQRLNLATTIDNIVRALDTPPRLATTSIDTVYATFEGPDAERLGIRELLGQGSSNFAGSPGNRRKNIALGGNKVHQSLLAPDAEFSLLKALGEIDGANGWLPELVIKGNQTIPEYGGGLCQIATTVFRSALNTGLPITERRNHSYRVRYYEPAGTDASIYDPSPDFKFKNDTSHWLLITQETIGDEIRFLVWGTKDGRVASSSTPVISNIIAPPPKKLIETTSLPPGTQKCTESAHAGATAIFDYEVSYASGEVKKTTFKSVYRPWQAVCLVGVAQLSVPGAPVPAVDASGLNSAG